MAQEQTQPTDPTEIVRSRLLATLMDKVSQDPYPSSTMLDTIEELLTPDDVDDYTDLLLSKIEDDRFPSIPMISRLRELAV
jgi:hypothetical protein